MTAEPIPVDSGSLPAALDVLVPFWGLAGGVIKILDYAAHGADLGMAVTLWAPPPPDPASAIAELPVFCRLFNDPSVVVRPLDSLDLPTTPSRVVLFTEPTHHELIESAIDAPLGPDLIHLVQGTRHANPKWQQGRNYRLLHRPMHRIVVTPQVFDAIEPLANVRYPVTMILEGHDATFFGVRPEVPIEDDSRTRRLRVLYTTWKSDLGDRVSSVLADDPRFAFIAIRHEISWPALRNRYHGADIFLCSPGPEEGFYLPGLEAMAAEAAVVSSLVGGNASYLRPGSNALIADYDDSLGHVDALVQLAENPDLRRALTRAGRDTIAQHTLGRERDEFAELLGSRQHPASSAYDTNTDDTENS